MGANQSAPTASPSAIGIPIELQELHALCSPAQEHPRCPTALPFRPEKLDYTTLMKLPTNQNWIRTLQIIRTALDQRKTIPLEWFKKKPLHSILFQHTPRYFLLVSAATILLDQEWSSAGADGLASLKALPASDPGLTFLCTRPYWGAMECIPYVIEHMILIDYGLDPRPIRISKLICSVEEIYTKMWPHFYAFCRELVEFTNLCRMGVFPSSKFCQDHWSSYRLAENLAQHHADVVLMSYWFYTRRREISTDEFNAGLTGYTGVIQEMIQDIPEKGPDRLKRKLAVDMYMLIPAYVREGHRDELIRIAKELAARYGSSPVHPGLGGSSSIHRSRIDGDRLRHSVLQQGFLNGRGTTPPPTYREVMGL